MGEGNNQTGTLGRSLWLQQGNYVAAGQESGQGVLSGFGCGGRSGAWALSWVRAGEGGRRRLI